MGWSKGGCAHGECLTSYCTKGSAWSMAGNKYLRREGISERGIKWRLKEMISQTHLAKLYE